MLKGETLRSGAPKRCSGCGVVPELQVCKSAAGYYIGTYCECGPYSRESCYYGSEEDAEEELKNKTWVSRNSNYTGRQS
jgi:hypothetical protein